MSNYEPEMTTFDKFMLLLIVIGLMKLVEFIFTVVIPAGASPNGLLE